MKHTHSEQQPKVATIVPTGTSNMLSIQAALTRLGWTYFVAQNSCDIENATTLILPGVGTYAEARQKWDGLNLYLPLQNKIESQTCKVLAICLGFQLLFEESEESPGITGLKVLKGKVQSLKKFTTQRVPHMGWNTLRENNSFMYFAHSYALPVQEFLSSNPKSSINIATTAYGESEFISMLSSSHMLACQFHPELSGQTGMQLLQKFLNGE